MDLKIKLKHYLLITLFSLTIFSVHGTPNWLEINEFVAEEPANTPGIAKNILNAIRSPANVISGQIVYPAIHSATPEINLSAKSYLESKGFIVKEISLLTPGTLPSSLLSYQAVIVTHPDTMDKEQWCIDAFGNGMSINDGLITASFRNYSNGCNTLLVNGPSVGKSEPWPTRYRMGSGFEAGIQFLEQEAKASHIIMRGLSLGGGMMGEAVIQHQFLDSTHYLFISDRTFNKLTDVVKSIGTQIAGSTTGKVAAKLFQASGTELDNVASAKKLSALNIPHIIIQHNGGGTDGVIPDVASLGFHLHQLPNLKNKIFIESSDIPHNGALPPKIDDLLKQEITQFLTQ
ncbi:MAG: hypothetical protein Q8K60_06500 [Parachlamydiaceae bacterium]|nr:hypothetical protein [Parachlamydiaceae bacterium]